MTNKIRLDAALVERGLEASRERAKALIMSGIVYVDNQKADKAGLFVTENNKIEIIGKKLKYVSRGGLKLEKAAEAWNLDFSGKICMDIGASTGGFTDFMLQNGAAKVYAVDVGYGQLAWSLRTDDRVVNLERTNFRYIEKEKIEPLDFASVDVSFISLSHIFPTMFELLREDGEAVCLIKPQFEAGREKVGKKGVVREEITHIEVIEKCASEAEKIGFCVVAIEYSPIKGPEGNIEFLLYLKKSESAQSLKISAEETVKRAHAELIKE